MGRTLAELRREFDDKYGVDWDRTDDLTEEEEIEWVEACYDYYENECEQKDVYGGPYSDMAETWYGHPFELVSRVDVNDPDYDLCAMPLWLIRITDMDGDPEDPGEFAAYPEELFIDPADA